MGHVQRVHVVGAGLAGLGAAVALTEAGVPVTLYEGARQAGGRCRSYYDASLGHIIDNGNHLVLSGNPAVHRFLKTIGAEDRLRSPQPPGFPFLDLRTGERWTMRPNDGPVPWWVAAKDRAVPGTNAFDYLAAAPLLFPPKGSTVAERLDIHSDLAEKLWNPILIAALNTELDQASAPLAGRVLRETMAKGGRAYRPEVAYKGLGQAFIVPALDYLEANGTHIRFAHRLKGLGFTAGEVRTLDFSDASVDVAPGERVILAVPPWAAGDLVPDLDVPDEHRAILNGHFRVTPPQDMPLILGLVGGTVEWMFAYDDHISVTISAADRFMEADREALAIRLWEDVARALDLPDDLPDWQIVKEKRATIAATPAMDAKRPAQKTRWPNLFLAGDWVATGLPATIEGALRSGTRAAELAQKTVL